MKKSKQIEFKQVHEEHAYFTDKICSEQPKLSILLKTGNKDAENFMLEEFNRYKKLS